MNFINFRQWGLTFITYFDTSQNDLFSAELAMHVRYAHHLEHGGQMTGAFDILWVSWMC